jgi:hypothetical protein
MLSSVPRLSTRGSPIPRGGYRTCCTEERALLASISTIVVVAGQTPIHTATVSGRGAGKVPVAVPEAFRGECACHNLCDVCAAVKSQPVARDPVHGLRHCESIYCCEAQ